MTEDLAPHGVILGVLDGGASTPSSKVACEALATAL
jgi:hypothetical protein